MNIRIKKNIYQLIIEHAKQEHPIESCGYLAGKDNEITRFYPMRNVDKSPDHFSFDPKEQFQSVKEARKEGVVLLSVYHSHPESPARLSEEDIRLLNDPNMIYIIVSLMDGQTDVKAYRIQKNELDIHVIRLEMEVV